EREEYEALRDFGFGTPTGVPYPAESRGRLPVPTWHAQTASALAMGYEMMATPLQIAAAYIAIANDGELLQPSLIRHVRDADGREVFALERRVVRRAMQPATSRLMRTILASVVDSGTAVAADMATYDVAGKSGTARRVQDGAYRGGHNSTFAGMFPAQAPQYVLVVRLIDPQGKIYGGTVAGRIVNEILQSALATRDASLDRRALAAVVKPVPVSPRKPLSSQAIAAALRDTARFDSLRAPAPVPVPMVAVPGRVVVSLPYSPAASAKPVGGARRHCWAAGIPPRPTRVAPKRAPCHRCMDWTRDRRRSRCMPQASGCRWPRAVSRARDRLRARSCAAARRWCWRPRSDRPPDGARRAAGVDGGGRAARGGRVGRRGRRRTDLVDRSR
ncbi:MAG: hypothetical protein IPP90_11930, partial [Gemmatimonadaceae bacterium]|nr:hypothetical protein [Gemmatimonadaceae bacterium]